MAPQNPAAALSSLLRAATIDDHDEVLRTANAALKADKNDATAQTTRVVALLKLDRFDDALRALAEGGVKLEATCAIEKAYALYKTGNLDDAAAFLKSAGLDKTGFSHIAAQVAYRSERFDEAHAIYKRLLDSSPGSEENDLNINSKAAFAQSQWQSYSRSSPVAPSNVSKGQSSSDAFELCYNEACAYIASQDLDTAANLLQRAVRLCDASDELTQEDKHAEMRPILAQQAYVYAKMGKLKEALDLYQSLGSTRYVYNEAEHELKLIISSLLVTATLTSPSWPRTTSQPWSLAQKTPFCSSAKQPPGSPLRTRRNSSTINLHSSPATSPL